MILKSKIKELKFSKNRSSNYPFPVQTFSNSLSKSVEFANDYRSLLENGYEEYRDSGYFAKKEDIPLMGQIGYNKYSEMHYDTFNNVFHLKDNMYVEARKLYEMGVKSPSHIITEGKKYTFGIEIETCSGTIPQFHHHRLNVKSEYDGSIYSDKHQKAYGGEYVTGILTGDYGFFHLYEIFQVLSRYTKINKTCSIHVHLGGFDFNKENMVLLWILAQKLEAQLFELMPYSRRGNAYCNNMKKIKSSVSQYDYSNSIDTAYKEIVKIVSLGNEPGQLVNKKLNHPAGRNCGYNQSTPRYWWINFVPSLFSITGIQNHTIEFRLHAASLSYVKVKNIILIYMAILSFVENNKLEIINSKEISLDYVVKSSFPKKAKYLIDYMNLRRQKFDVKKGLDFLNDSELSEYREFENNGQKLITNKKELL